MSFFMTTDQIVAESKTVTRRFGWWFLKPGDKLQACEKCQGLGKGGKINRLKVIEVVSTSHEQLCDISASDCIREGFPDMTPKEFVIMLCEHYGCNPDKIVNRIEFKYVESEATK